MTGTRPRPRPPRDRGAALILVVWAIGLMSVMAAMVARDAHLDARESRLTRETLSARLLAESAVRLALERLESETGAGAQAFPFQCDLPEGRIAVDVRPVSALIDINTAQEETLAALFTVLGASGPEASGMAARIADFRDGDATPRPGGAEAPQYQRAGLAWRPANRPLARLGELSEVLGLDPEILAAALPHLTVHSHNVRVDPALATPEVAAALKAFGAFSDEGIDGDDRAMGAAGSVSGMAGGPVVVRVAVRTQAGQSASLAATYGSRPRGDGALRPLMEEHPAGNSLYLAEGARLPETRPCL